MGQNRILITGGTGLIGSAFRHSIEASGTRILQLLRRTPNQGEAAVQWQPENPDTPLLKDADTSILENCTAAVHLAGANLSSHRWTGQYKRTILDSRVDSSHALIKIFSQLRKPPATLICASAVGIYGDRGDEVLTEKSAPGQGFLPEVCEAWEAAPDAAKALGIRVVHLRFGVVLDPAGGAMQKLLPVFKAGLGGRLGDGRQWVSWVTLNDVVRAIQFAIDNPDAQGAFNTVSPNPITNAEFTRAFAKAVKRPAPWIVPAFALNLAFGQMAQDTLLASSRVIPERLAAIGFQFQDAEIGPALVSLLRPRA